MNAKEIKTNAKLIAEQVEAEIANAIATDDQRSEAYLQGYADAMQDVAHDDIAHTDIPSYSIGIRKVV